MTNSPIKKEEKSHFHRIVLASGTGTVTARLHLLDFNGRSFYYAASIPTTGLTGYDICVLANAASALVIVDNIVGADLIYSDGIMYANTSGDGTVIANATAPTSTTGKQINAVSQTAWVSLGKVV